jgi:hypothetical protein
MRKWDEVIPIHLIPKMKGRKERENGKFTHLRGLRMIRFGRQSSGGGKSDKIYPKLTTTIDVLAHSSIHKTFNCGAMHKLIFMLYANA